MNELPEWAFVFGQNSYSAIIGWLHVRYVPIRGQHYLLTKGKDLDPPTRTSSFPAARMRLGTLQLLTTILELPVMVAKHKFVTLLRSNNWAIDSPVFPPSKIIRCSL